VVPSKKRARHTEDLKPEIKSEVFAIILFAAAILLFINLLISDGGGFLGGALKRFLVGTAGFGAYTLPFIMLLWGMALLLGKSKRVPGPKVVMCSGIFVIVITFIHMVSLDSTLVFERFGGRAAYLYENGAASNGGFIGGVLSNFLAETIGRGGSYIIMVAAFIVLFILVTGKSLIDAVVRALVRIDAELSKFGEKPRDDDVYGYEDDGEYETDDFEYDPRETDSYVYETQSKRERVVQPPVLKTHKKPENRKIFDYVVDEDDDSFGYEDEPAIYLMDEPRGKTRNSDKKDYSDKIVEFRKADEPADIAAEYDLEPGEIPPWEFEPDVPPEPLDSVKEAEKEEIADNALAGLAALVEPDWESGISIKGTGVEGYVPTTVTTAASGEDFVAADLIKADFAGAAKSTAGNSGKQARLANTAETSDEGQKPYTLPPVNLLAENTYTPSPSSKAQILENSRKLEETLKSFGVEARVVEVSKGPTVTRYELSPGVGVKVSKISSLADDLALNLAALGIRIEAPIPGKSVVGIEIPNSEVQTVFLRDVVDGDAFWSFPSKLGFAVGKDIAGNSVIVDIAKMPHLLIAGATGAGKSVCINTIIASILLKSTPEEVKMLMIDPKVVELNVYNGIPHLEIPVVTDPQKASGALSWGVREMNERYNMFARTGTRDLRGYNETLIQEGEKPLPQIIIIIDELADLMMSCKSDVEQNICRLAQKARAAGIHLIIATQRPSVDVITGLIKANVPSRLAFAVTSGTDSRTILDMVGAEKLLGKGDMLFSPAGLAKPQRIQGAFISDKEVERLVSFIKKENGEAVYDAEKIERITATDGGGDDDFGEDADEFIREAISFVTDKGKASVSMLQRQFRIGYNRAARMMEMLEARGIVGPEDGAKPRKVLAGTRFYEDL